MWGLGFIISGCRLREYGQDVFSWSVTCSRSQTRDKQDIVIPGHTDYARIQYMKSRAVRKGTGSKSRV